MIEYDYELKITPRHQHLDGSITIINIRQMKHLLDKYPWLVDCIKESRDILDNSIPKINCPF